MDLKLSEGNIESRSCFMLGYMDLSFNNCVDSLTLPNL